MVAQKGCNNRWDSMISHIGVASHHSWSFLSAIELTVLCTFICKVWYLMLKLGGSTIQVGGFDFTCIFGEMQFIVYMEWIYETTCIPHYFMYSICKNCCINFKPFFLAKSTYFRRFPYLYLSTVRVLCTWGGLFGKNSLNFCGFITLQHGGHRMGDAQEDKYA